MSIIRKDRTTEQYEKNLDVIPITTKKCKMDALSLQHLMVIHPRIS